MKRHNEAVVCKLTSCSGVCHAGCRSFIAGLVVWFALFAPQPSPASSPAVSGRETISVTTTGAVGDGVTDDWWSFQQAIERAAANPVGGTVLVPASPAGGAYRISQALRMRSDVRLVVLNENTVIKCSGDPWRTWHTVTDPSGAVVSRLARWPTYSCIMFGAYESNIFARVPADPGDGVAAGGTRITLVVPGAAGRYAVGDVVSVQTKTEYTIGKGEGSYTVPTWRHLDRVAAVDKRSNTVTLAHPVVHALASSNLLRLTNGTNQQGWPTLVNSDGEDTGIPLWATHDAEVVGGTWDGLSASVPFSPGSGAVDCRADVHAVSGLGGIGSGNALARCHFHADHEMVSDVVNELAEGSHDNTVDVDVAETVQSSKAGSRTVPRYVGVNEGSYSNHIRFSSVNIGGNIGINAVEIMNASNNLVFIGSLSGKRIAGDVVHIVSLPYAGIPSVAVGNVVQIGTSSLQRQATYVTILNQGTFGNTVEGGRFLGSITASGGYGFYIGGAAGGRNTIRGSYGEMGIGHCDATVDPSNTLENLRLDDTGSSLSGTDQRPHACHILP